MKKCKRAVALIISLVMCLVLAAACGNSGSSPTSESAPESSPAFSPASSPPATASTTPAPPQMVEPPPKAPDIVFADHIDVILDNNIGVINPFSPAANNTPTNWAFILIFDRLLNRNDDTGEYEPALATSWTTADYQTFVLDLREDVYFHNGDHFTAHDVVYTVELSREIGAASQGAAQWAPVNAVTALSDYRVEFVLNFVYFDFYFNLSTTSACILNKRAIEANLETGTWVGTGAYEVAEFVSNDYVKLARNDRFWDDRLIITTPNLTLRYIPEMATRTTRMETGESQLSFGTSSEDLSIFRNKSDDYEVFQLKFNNPQGLSFNMNDPITSDWNFRMAVMYAMDKDDIAFFAAADGAEGDYISGTIWGNRTEFRNDDIPVIPHNIDKAKEHLAMSVYDGEEVELAAAIPTNISAAQALQQQLKVVGINTRIAEYDSPGLSAYMFDPNSGSQMIFLAVAFTLSSASFRNIFYPNGSQNRMWYNNPVITQMIDEVAAMLDRDEREAHFRKMQEIIAEDPPYVTVFWRINGIVAARGVGGLKMPADHMSTDLRQIYWILD